MFLSDTIEKGTSRGSEWRKIQLSVRSYELGKKSDQNHGHGLRPETENLDTRQETENFDFGKKRIPSKRASQEEQNGTHFSSVVPSSEELRARNEI